MIGRTLRDLAIPVRSYRTGSNKVVDLESIVQRFGRLAWTASAIMAVILIFKLYTAVGGNFELLLAALERTSLTTMVSNYVAVVAFAIFNYILLVAVVVGTNPTFPRGPRLLILAFAALLFFPLLTATSTLTIVFCALFYAFCNLRWHFLARKSRAALQRWAQLNLDSVDADTRELASQAIDPGLSESGALGILSKVNLADAPESRPTRSGGVLLCFMLLVNFLIVVGPAIPTYTVETDQGMFPAYIFRGGSDTLLVDIQTKLPQIVGPGSLKSVSLCQTDSTSSRLLAPPLGRSVSLPRCY